MEKWKSSKVTGSCARIIREIKQFHMYYKTINRRFNI